MTDLRRARIEPLPVRRPGPASVTGSSYYPQIEGLRALAALLVAVYHIWMQRVSGGVDVFFMVSGFLVTMALLRRVEHHGRVKFAEFYAGLIRRLAPASMIVLLVTVAVSLYILPEVRWHETAREALASALYYENWQLALNAVDYLARDNLPSPLQHYWALSVQGQFYLLWPLVIAAAALLSRSALVAFRPALMLGFGTLLAGSLAYATVSTNVGAQSWAYFDTGARMWEFAIGGLLALALPMVTLPERFRDLLGWFGLIGIISCGAVLQVSTSFPGIAALWPTLSAVLVILAGSDGGRWGPQWIMTSGPLVSLGAISYGIYLWHWPLLVFHRTATGTQQPSLAAGLAIIGGAVVLAYATARFIEWPIRRTRSANATRNALVGGSFVVPAVVLASGWLVHLQIDVSRGNGQPYGDSRHPGAAALARPRLAVPEGVPLLPALDRVKRDLPRSYRDGCHLSQRTAMPWLCIYGHAEGFRRTIAVVGGSHSAQWLPAIERIAEAERWRIVYTTKSACRFSTEEQFDVSCQVWNDAVLQALRELQPDLVFVTANIRNSERPPRGYIAQWRRLGDDGVRVFAVRDNPEMPFDAAECVNRHQDDLDECAVERTAVLAREFDTATVPDNVTVADLSDYFCRADVCPSVVGNVIVYRDNHHLTATYVSTLAPLLKRPLGEAMYAVPAQTQAGIAPQIRIAGTLACDAGETRSPIRRDMVVTITGSRVAYAVGDTEGRERRYEIWDGHISENGAVSVRGTYRADPAGPEKFLLFSGTHRDGALTLVGARGSRRCDFVGTEW